MKKILCAALAAVLLISLLPGCGQKMKEIIPGTTEAATEKHIPVYTVENNIVKVNVGEVAHPMLSEHYIEWVALVAGNKEYVVNLKPGEKAEARFTYVENSKLYAYCNKHGLWETEVK